ncbi:ABC transporter ATP-binding protein, partial [Vibrio cholerae]|nr:ABC transporter ATP-binding protein [Vibrio cholerae]
TISKGKAVGVIGKNGAGKSTLLKLITGTLSPTTGSIKVNGSVAAILELGMGFNPELSGRENAFHSAGLMGKDRKEIHEHIKMIEEFAEIGEHFDEPVRTYSSGMQARLAFSVATAFRPDLLIVDEALSVGDVSFQAKCFQHMLDMKRKGTAILLVSHDSQAIKNFCDEA